MSFDSWVGRRTGDGAYRAGHGTPPPHPPPAAGELLLTGALLSLYVGLRGGAWAVGTLERGSPARRGAPPADQRRIAPLTIAGSRSANRGRSRRERA